MNASPGGCSSGRWVTMKTGSPQGFWSSQWPAASYVQRPATTAPILEIVSDSQAASSPVGSLLEAEKELTRRSDELARRRQQLSWVRIEKDYRFEMDEGSASLADLFRGRSQLLVYHFMFGPE